MPVEAVQMDQPVVSLQEAEKAVRKEKPLTVRKIRWIPVLKEQIVKTAQKTAAVPAHPMIQEAYRTARGIR